MLQQAELIGFPTDISSRHASDRHPVFKNIITANPRMERIFRMIEKLATSGSTVLITGESGTGKELIARAIHELSDSTGHLVPVNCGAIPDNLLESELFGHEKGAFTGAISSRPGRFVMADNGTIFLDEIGEMTPSLQVKLLRVIQDKVVESVGGVKPRSVNVRIIAATNRNLLDQVKEGKFREDLFYRLQVVPIELPSLRERPEDIELLVNFFSKKYAEENDRRPLVFSVEAMAALKAYNWPGNIRELENLIERLTVLVDGDAVYETDLPTRIANYSSQVAFDPMMALLPESGVDFNALVDGFENSLIIQALERTNGNKKAAARLLNLNRTTLVEKIKKKGLEVRRDPEEQNSL
ncbi:MAG: sigma-54-dependent Fis family transcriptional regulator [Deltaproteobacteria bacterium]|nr:sigma-54-dependent Fis family transcriptional regulator [Deltaproteobacteria bacterium]